MKKNEVSRERRVKVILNINYWKIAQGLENITVVTGSFLVFHILLSFRKIRKVIVHKRFEKRNLKSIFQFY